ncbi:MAG: BON domain-containing protein [Candidatus Pseudobacter hemicellulosilyticus]|uniref:BON domain-containing protein n=1 Tax=Candidatus Pseudobacter hemicellulosilyticus TaxID=3121375 RepID=A0AAJ5WWK4_9BACT|nr:MAG: BON domain-containing protein [Pseudobacter sp.]
MKKWIACLALSLFMAALLPACKSKPTDAELEKAASTALSAHTDKGPLPMVSVKEGVATLTGEVRDENAKTAFRTAVAGVKGITEVSDQTSVQPPAPDPVTITPDDPLIQSVNMVVKDYPTVKVEVKEGVITLTGEVTRPRLQPLMIALNGLKPKKIENKLTIK